MCFYGTGAKGIFFTGNLIVIEMHNNMTLQDEALNLYCTLQQYEFMGRR